MPLSTSFPSYDLGATLYMPVIHPKVLGILFGTHEKPSSSIVLCLEDALDERDVERGISMLEDLASSASEIRPDMRVFIRPRSLGMADRLLGIRGLQKFSGIVAPKVRIETIHEWFSVLSGTSLRLMPTIESAEFFDPSRMIMFREMILKEDISRIAAVRLGGNDLMGSMGLRRQAGITAYEGPLGWFLSMTASILIPSGIPVSAPVYDVISDLETLQREVERDVQMGFVSKTAIHPAQTKIIEAALRPSVDEVQAANSILEKSAKAVFQIGGVMCEPATHANWAERILAREAAFGVSEICKKRNGSKRAS